MPIIEEAVIGCSFDPASEDQRSIFREFGQIQSENIHLSDDLGGLVFIEGSNDSASDIKHYLNASEILDIFESVFDNE